MKKHIVATLLASLLGIICNPEMLAASDHVTISDLDNSRTSQTVLQTRVEMVTVAKTASSIATPAPLVAKATPVVATSVKTPANEIKIAGRTLAVEATDNTANDAGTHVNYYDKLLYGHNTRNVFGVLTSVKVGDKFTVSFDGKTTTYRVASVVVYKKSSLTERYQDGTTLTTPMARIARRAEEYAKNSEGKLIEVGTHDVALMTCHGQALPGNDATERLVIYADAI